MPRTNTATIDDDPTEPGPVRVFRPAVGAPKPKTTAAASIFAAGQAANPKRAYVRSPLDPHAVEVKMGVPIPARTRTDKTPSTYAALFARMPVGACVTLTRKQATSFQAWCNDNGHKGELVSRKLGADQVGVWRVAPTA